MSVRRYAAGCLAAGLSVLLLGGRASAEANEPTSGEVVELIEQLGSEQYIERQRAERELLRLGAEAFDALTAAESHPDLEVAARARYLARRITVDWVREEDPADVKRLMENYEGYSDEQRGAVVGQLLALPEGAGIPAVTRIVRFEKAPRLSKSAVAIWLSFDKADAAHWQQHRETIERGLGSSNRLASSWLRAQLQSVSAPEQAVAAWDQIVADEMQTLEREPQESSRAIVLALMRRKVALLRELDRDEQAVAAMIDMIDLEDGSSQTLTELVDWLVQQKAWTVVDRVAERFKVQISGDWSLLYLLAEARQAQGESAQADELAKRAFELEQGSPGRHLRAAYYLQKRGSFEWAEREYREVIRLGPPHSRWAMLSAVWLSEMLHDQLQDEQAGKLLQTISDELEKDAAVLQALQRIDKTPASLRSRMEFFFAEAAAARGDAAKQKQHLDRAIQHDPTDADVLIARYHLPQADEQYRAQTRKLIERAATIFDEQIDNDPEDASRYNLYAWLIGNTEGDLDKALRYSHHSLDLSPNTAGFLDTLAHCYYTKGDYANAVRYQERAVELDPHSGLIGRPLKQFRAALRKQQAAEKKDQ